MLTAALLDAWPLAVLLVVVCGGLATLVRLLRSACGADVSPAVPRRAGETPTQRRRPILALHRDEFGSVQSLSFVLTVPIFIMLVLLAVQITQLMIGQIVVHFAAFAAARSATVWIPARVGSDVETSGENRIGLARNLLQNGAGGELYQISPGGLKFEKIRQAAALACVPIAPSHKLGLASGDQLTQSLQATYAALSPTAASNPKIPQRLANKWAYATATTGIQIYVFHRRYGPGNWDEPPLQNYYPPDPDAYYKANEIGWRDQIRVTVTHNFALLPGPGRLLARTANQSFYRDAVSPQIRTAPGGVYWIPLSATATMVGDGEKSVRPYVY
jgi:hypothetical protein